jgi:hypothetical protein
MSEPPPACIAEALCAIAVKYDPFLGAIPNEFSEEADAVWNALRANRWAAFTSDELAALWVDTDPSRGPLVLEIRAELERRRGA